MTSFTAALLQLEGVELQLSSIQHLFCLLMQSHLYFQLPLCIHQLDLRIANDEQGDKLNCCL